MRDTSERHETPFVTNSFIGKQASALWRALEVVVALLVNRFMLSGIILVLHAGVVGRQDTPPGLKVVKL